LVIAMTDHSSDPQSAYAPTQRWRQLLAYGLLTLTGTGAIMLSSQTAPSSARLIEPPLLAQNSPGSAVLSNRGSNFIADVVEEVGPAVVRINAARTVAQRQPSIFNDPVFREFFGDLGGAVPPSSRVQEGTGSGFIIDNNGTILTNAHVIEGADRVTVTLRDGRELPGRVVGQDALTDVAVIQVEANNLPTVSVGNSDQLRPGEWAIAIGNPLGLDNTVTVGIISATGRSSAQIRVPDQRVQFIQTDAAINPGNSGGPLLNEQGQVIGMNTAIIGGAQGLGFAIPINTARNIADQLIANGRVDHPYLGIQMQTLTAALREQVNRDRSNNLSVTAERGVLVVQVMANSPAARAGLRSGDVITAIDGDSVTTADQVQQRVSQAAIGSPLQLQIQRGSSSSTVAVSPAAMPTRASR
jgi:Do/DeqQ family serine protease